ncbi:MAG: zf-HC2 domain-containing protein [Adhaeribacter sp.]
MKTTATHLNPISTQEGATPDCTKVVSLLDQMVDGEATEEDRIYFLTHVETCKPCFEAHQKHQRLKEVLKANIERKAVPANLLSSIKNVIKATA